MANQYLLTEKIISHQMLMDIMAAFGKWGNLLRI